MRRRSWQVLGGLVLSLGMTSPAQAVSATAFVPDGYYVEHQVSVDIDADGLTDRVFKSSAVARPRSRTPRATGACS